MKRVLLHGSPATGKLTAAKALLRMAAGPAQEIIRRFGPGVAQNDRILYARLTARLIA